MTQFQEDQKIIRELRADNERLRGDKWRLLAEIDRLQSIIRKQMEPTEISQRLAECNELSDAYREQCADIERLRAELLAVYKKYNLLRL